jgi:hypothetical protein
MNRSPVLCSCRRRMRIRETAWVLLISLAWAQSSQFSQAGTGIFDDNWSPPISQTRPAKLPQPAPSTGARRPIPSHADLVRSCSLCKELFATQLANRTMAGRRALAEQLLESAEKPANSPTDAFVLLTSCIAAAKEASDLQLVVDAAGRLSAAYQVDGLRLQTDSALRMSLRGETRAATAANATAALDVMGQLIAAEDYADGGRLLARLRPVATSDRAIFEKVQARAKELESLRAASERIAPEMEKLRSNPYDRSAKLAVGSFLCFAKRDWDRGLPLLAKGTDEALAGLAASDLSHPSTPDEQGALAARWWSFAQRRAEPERAPIRRHASDIYLQAVDGLSGPNQGLALRRLAECAAAERLSSPFSNRSVLLFKGNGREEAIFNAISDGAMRVVERSESADVLADAAAMARPGIIVFGVDFLKGAPPDALGEPMQRNIKHFVESGGDLIVFAQHAEEHTELMDALFGVKLRVLTFTGALPAVPELAALMRAARLMDPTVQKRATFYDSLTIPPNGVAFLYGGAPTHLISAAGVPFGRGRVILIGNNVDPVEAPITECILDYVYHYKG